MSYKYIVVFAKKSHFSNICKKGDKPVFPMEWNCSPFNSLKRAKKFLQDRKDFGGYRYVDIYELKKCRDEQSNETEEGK